MIYETSADRGCERCVECNHDLPIGPGLYGGAEFICSFCFGDVVRGSQPKVLKNWMQILTVPGGYAIWTTSTAR